MLHWYHTSVTCAPIFSEFRHDMMSCLNSEELIIGAPCRATWCDGRRSAQTHRHGGLLALYHSTLPPLCSPAMPFIPTLPPPLYLSDAPPPPWWVASARAPARGSGDVGTPLSHYPHTPWLQRLSAWAPARGAGTVGVRRPHCGDILDEGQDSARDPAGYAGVFCARLTHHAHPTHK